MVNQHQKSQRFMSIHSDSGFDSTEFQEILRNDSDSKNCGPKSHDNTSLLLQMRRPIPKIQSVSQYSFEVGSDGFLSPGSSMFDNFMPCGISTPEIARFWEIIIDRSFLIHSFLSNRSVDFRMTFWCLKFSKKPAKIWWISALEFKKWLNQTIKGPFSC